MVQAEKILKVGIGIPVVFSIVTILFDEIETVFKGITWSHVTIVLENHVASNVAKNVSTNVHGVPSNGTID